MNKKMDVNRLIDLFIMDVCAGKKNETEQAYRTKLKMFARYLDKMTITSKVVNDFRLDMLTRDKHYSGRRTPSQGKLSVFTVRTVMVTVRHFCKWLYLNDFIRENIAPGVKVPQLPQPQPKAIRQDSMEALLSAALVHGDSAQRARNVAIIYWLRDTGGRVGGLLNAKLEDLNINDGIIETTEKGKTVQEFLNPETLRVLSVWLSYRGDFAKPECKFIFVGFTSGHGVCGNKMTRSGIYNLFRSLARQAGVKYEGMNPHAFRHAYARDYLLEGGELTQLAGILHHTSIWVTATYYTRWNITELKKAHATRNLVSQLERIKTDVHDLDNS